MIVVAVVLFIDCLNHVLLGPPSSVIVHRRVCTADAQRVFRLNVVSAKCGLSVARHPHRSQRLFVHLLKVPTYLATCLVTLSPCVSPHGECARVWSRSHHRTASDALPSVTDKFKLDDNLSVAFYTSSTHVPVTTVPSPARSKMHRVYHAVCLTCLTTPCLHSSRLPQFSRWSTYFLNTTWNGSRKTLRRSNKLVRTSCQQGSKQTMNWNQPATKQVQAKQEMAKLVAEQTAENVQAVSKSKLGVQTQATVGTVSDKAAQQTTLSVFNSVFTMQSLGCHKCVGTAHGLGCDGG